MDFRRDPIFTGLDTIHRLTKGGVPALFQVTTWDGVTKYAEYSHFEVDSEANKYKLTVTGHSGDLCDDMNYHNQQIFVTKDRWVVQLKGSTGKLKILKWNAPFLLLGIQLHQSV